MRAPTDSGGFGQSLLKQNLVPAGGSSVIARTDVLRELGGFDPSFSTLADWEMWIRLQQAGPVAGVDRPLVGYLVHPQGMSTDVGLLRADMARLRAKFGAEYERPEHAVGQHMWRSYVGYRQLGAGQRLGAAANFVGAAWAGRRALQVAAAVAAVITPGWVLRRRAANVHAEIPTDWLAEARLWLAPLDVV